MTTSSDSFLTDTTDTIEEGEEESFSDFFVEDNQPIIDFDQSIDEITETSTIGRSIVSSTTSSVWNFFTKKEETKEDQNGEEQIIKYIYCKVGECHLSTNNSTTTLERHLKAKHHSAYLRLHQQIDEDIEPWVTERQKEKHEFLVNWVIIDQQPFTIVENQSFQKFMLEVQPKYKLPSRHTLKDMIVSKFITS
jgi:hypothetical protein